jgi:hypothetical protein
MVAQSSRSRRTWLAAIAALVTAVGVRSILETVAFVLANTWSASGGLPEWTGNPYSSGLTGSLVLTVVRALAFGVAGFVGAWFAPRHSWLALLALLAVAVVATFFDQLPPTHTTAWFVAWNLSAPSGILLGAGLLWRSEHGA